jgi:hypothetical protein
MYTNIYRVRDKKAFSKAHTIQYFAVQYKEVKLYSYFQTNR